MARCAYEVGSHGKPYKAVVDPNRVLNTFSLSSRACSSCGTMDIQKDYNDDTDSEWKHSSPH